MKEINNSEIESILFDLSKKFILPKYNNLNQDEIKIKNENEIFTCVDVLVEEELCKILCKLLPGSLFVGEEKFSKFPKIINNYKENKYCWTVDPLDGTKNFVKGKEKFAVMIALTFGNKILQSWIYKPLSNEIYYAIKNQGTFFHGKKITTNRKNSIKDSIGSISTKYWDKKNLLKMQTIKLNFLEIKSYGCIGLEYVDIVNNKRDFAILSKLSPWDHISGIFLLREAGGFDCYFDKGSYNYCFQKRNLIVANNTKLGEQILSIIKE